MEDQASSRPPVIGVTRCEALPDYVGAIERTGARVRILEINESPRSLVDAIDGVLLTGGGDVDPALYREAPHETFSDAEPGRDEFELDLARRAMAGGLPLLGICRGAQVLNVAAGGTLIQDIPSVLTASGRHDIASPKDALAHSVDVTPGSTLASVLGSPGRHEVNSRHHQAVATVGRGLVVCATASDGVIEGIEAPGATFCVGVQWHPENFWRSGEFLSLFRALARAARQRMAAD